MEHLPIASAFHERRQQHLDPARAPSMAVASRMIFYTSIRAGNLPSIHAEQWALIE